MTRVKFSDKPIDKIEEQPLAVNLEHPFISIRKTELDLLSVCLTW